MKNICFVLILVLFFSCQKRKCELELNISGFNSSLKTPDLKGKYAGNDYEVIISEDGNSLSDKEGIIEVRKLSQDKCYRKGTFEIGTNSNGKFFEEDDQLICSFENHKLGFITVAKQNNKPILLITKWETPINNCLDELSIMSTDCSYSKLELQKSNL